MIYLALNSEYPINRRFVRKVIMEELMDYRKYLSCSGFSISQQFRGWFIEWFACFLPEVFNAEVIEGIEAVIAEIKGNEVQDCYSFGDPKISPLKMAMFLLSQSEHIPDIPFVFFSSHDSSLRTYAYETVAFAAPKIKYQIRDFTDILKSSLKRSYFYVEELIFLIAIAQGEAKRKIRFFREIQKSYPDNPYSDDFKTLIKEGTMKNPFLINFIQPLKGYVIGRLTAAKHYLETEKYDDRSRRSNVDQLSLQLQFDEEEDEFLKDDEEDDENLWRQTRKSSSHAI